MNRIFPLFLLFALFLFRQSTAQIKGDTLKEVEVRSGIEIPGESKREFQAGAKTVVIDSAILRQYRQQSIATLLSQVSSVFVKSYGFNSLATLSFRGASAAQSAVFWEGVPLMNGATGISDVSLLPVAFSDSVSIMYGSSGALGGSGNVGGALLLQSAKPSFREGFHCFGGMQVGLGSFGQVPATAEIGFRTARLAVRARGIYSRAANDFLATDEYGNSFTTQNAGLHGGGVLIDASFRAGKRDVISLHAWQQAYSREIPRALFEAISVKKQKDGAVRFLLDWSRNGKRTQQYAKAAFLQDNYGYEDAAIGLSTDVTTRHFFGEWGLSGRAGASTSWLLFVPIQYMTVSRNVTTGQQTRVALAGNVKRAWMDRRLSIALNGRAERIDQKLIVLPGAGADFQITRALKLRTSIQRSYRMPTLNELYYNPGGNIGLKPESGWSIDGGYAFSKGIAQNVHFTHSISAFNRHINDWIIWLGGAIWTPHNLAAVHSRGLETETEMIGSLGQVHWRLLVSAAYTRSTPTESYLQNDNSIGMQIPYTPRFTGSGIATASWLGFSMTYVQSYAGKRFITSDESASLPAYSTGNVHLGYAIHEGKARLNFNASLQNIWNNSYAVVAYRPMPGVNYLFSIAFSHD